MTPFTAGPASTSQYDSPARLVSGDAPVYPLTKLYEAKPGRAVVRFTITEEGIAKDIVVVQADEPSFGNHAVIAIRTWRFEPARKAGKPVPVQFEFEMTFGVN